jgi:hypothetical protein
MAAMRRATETTLTVEHYDPWDGSCTPDAVPGEPPLMADGIKIRASAGEAMGVELYADTRDNDLVLFISGLGADGSGEVKMLDGLVVTIEGLGTLISLLGSAREQARHLEWDPKPVTPGIK